MGLWSDDDEISCVHPGGPRLVGAVAIRASFEAMFANGTIDARPEKVRRLDAHSTRGAQRARAGRACSAAEGETFAWVVATNVYVKTTRGLAAGGASRQPGHRQRGAGDRRDGIDPALSRRLAATACDARLSRAALAAGRPCADHLAGALQPPLRRRARRRSSASAGRTPDGDFVDVDWLGRDAATRPCWCCSTASKARRRSHYAAGLRRRCARQRGWRFAVPHFRGCSGELNLAPRAYHSGDCEEVGWMLAPLSRAAPRRRSSRSASRSAATRCCAGPRRPATARCAARARDRRGLGAARPRRRRPRDRPRLQPAGLHPHVPALDEAQGAGASWRSTRACSTPSGCARRATCTSSTTSSPRRCTAFATPTTTGARGSAKPHLAPHPHPGAGAQRAQRPVRAGARPAARRTRSAATSRSGSREHGGHVGFRRRPLAGPRARRLPEQVMGWLDRHR